MEKLVVFGFLFLLIVHWLGWSANRENDFYTTKKIALWQTNIPIREKFSKKQLQKFPTALDDALEQASKSNAYLMVAPEGSLMADQELLNSSPLSFFTGGFRWVQNKQRSSLLVLEKDTTTYSQAIDKHRLVPLGEWIPSIPWLSSKGLSLVGGLDPGKSSRFLDWSDSPLGVAICYEISDGIALAKSSSYGAQWILSIANLDPYPISLQKQFIALGQIRSLELSKEVAVVANTGPTVLIMPTGEVKQLVEPFQEGIGFAEIKLSKNISGYVIWGEIPLAACLIITLSMIGYLNKLK